MRISVWSSDVCSSDLFKGIGGSNDPAMIQSFYAFDFERMVDLIDGLYGTCNRAGSADSCLADYTVDRRINAKTLAPYLQVENNIDMLCHPVYTVARQSVVSGKSVADRVDLGGAHIIQN